MQRKRKYFATIFNFIFVIQTRLLAYHNTVTPVIALCADQNVTIFTLTIQYSAHIERQ